MELKQPAPESAGSIVPFKLGAGLFALLALTVPPAVRGQSLNPGLVANFSDGSHRVKLVVPTPNFYLEPAESVHPGIANTFEAEWTGLLTILQTGDYQFESAAEVSIDGNVIGDGSIRLEPGRHPLRIRYRRPPGIAEVRLLWSSTGFAREPVPGSLFSHNPATGPSREETLAEKGRFLVEEYGCINCHASGSPSLQKRWGPRLTGIAARVKPAWLYSWLANTSGYRSGTVMPSMLDERQSRDVAAFLATLKRESRSAAGDGSSGDVVEGRRLYGAIGCATCHQPDSLPLDGIGSKMPLPALAAYLEDPFKVDPSGRMPSMMLRREEARDIAAFLTESRDQALERAGPSGDATRGREIVRRQGCLACHSLEDPDPVGNEHRAPRLEQLSPDRGCLSGAPRGVPRYRLDGESRAAMQAFLRSQRRYSDRSPAPVYELRRNLERLRCVACHESDNLKPTGSPAEAAPPLTDAGTKLRTRWISGVLSSHRRSLDWMHLRMPDYDPSLVESLVPSFAKAAGVAPGDGPPAPPSSDAERARGVELIGMNSDKGGMACLGCHDWGVYRSQGESGPQLIDVAERLRYDWFERWMLDPTRILSGTSMPNYFRTVAREPAIATIRTLWASLSMGERMPLPEGLRRASAVLGSEEKPVPDREAIIIRWDMPEATPAAIAVGLPGGLSYCFDAGESRLRYAWDGGFVDMSGTLHRKVDENKLTPTATLIGTIFYRAGEFPLRVGRVDREPERRFRGYRLVDGYPRFHYRVDGVDVFERIVPAPGSNGLTRQFTIRPVDKPMWFLASPGAGVSIRSTLGPFVEGRLSIPRGATVSFEVTVTKRE